MAGTRRTSCPVRQRRRAHRFVRSVSSELSEVIGHPAHVRENVTEQQIDQTIRTYNAHLSRVEVVTYKHLVDTAERALAFEATQAAGEPVLPDGETALPGREPLDDNAWLDEEPF